MALGNDRPRGVPTAPNRPRYAPAGSGAGVFQPLDAQLTDLSGLVYAGNALKVLRVNAGAAGFELALVSAGESRAKGRFVHG